MYRLASRPTVGHQESIVHRTNSMLVWHMDYTPTFQEQVTLKDGTLLELRAIRPSDKAVLTEGFGHLSAVSRRHRFHTAKSALSDADLRFLTECDGHSHYAIIAASEVASTGKPEGVGVARFVRTPENPDIAELAITVVDAWQHRGIGDLLLRRIVAAASEHEVERLHAVVLADNEGMKHLIAKYSGDVTFKHDNGVLIVDIPIGTASLTDRALSALRQLALRKLSMPLRHG